jgi:septal ring factor EnvC (AmiA/AmiB activator)
MNRARPTSRRLRCTAALVALLLAVPLPLPAQSGTAADQEAALQAVRKQIKALESRIARQTTQRDESARALRELEVASAASARKLAAVRVDLQRQQTRQRALAAEQRTAAANLAAQRAALATQVRLSYMTGREEVFKLLLSQENPADLGRMLAYYDYFNRARTVRIGAVNSDLERLRALEAQAAALRAELQALEETQAAEVAALGGTREERRTLLDRQDAELRSASRDVDTLRAEEQRLAALVKELTELLAGLPAESAEPFARVKGRLAWPVQGRVAGDFGRTRGAGPMRWNGVLLEAPQGTPVRAVYHGRVAYADWLPGLGLLLIIDHGGGYMSLYGHNEALLKEPGDWVAPGEPVAQVGDTGGQARPALYFEIRQNGAAVSPHPWIKK